MKKWMMVAAVLAAAGGSFARAEEAGAALGAVDAAAAIARLRLLAAAALPGMSHIAFVRDDEVYLDAGTGRGYVPGLGIEAYRPGAEIRSPATGEVIGRLTERVGRFHVEWADAGMSRARRMHGETRPISLGDLVRPETTASIGFLPLRHEDGRRTLLTRRIDDDIARAFSTGAPEAAARLDGPATALRPGDALLAAQVLPGATLVVGGRVEGGRLHIDLFRTSPSGLLAEISAPLSPDLLALAETAVEATPRPSGGTFAGAAATPAAGVSAFSSEGEIRLSLDPGILDAASGDIDGDGRDEILLLATRQVRVMRLTPGGSLDHVEEFGLGFSAEALRLSAGDLDGDGKDEIAVVEKPGDFVRSSIWRRGDRGFKKIQTFRGKFLRFVAFPDGERLYAQGYGHERVFDIGTTRLRWNGTRAVEEAGALPNEITLFDWAPIPEMSLTASIDPENRIRLYNAAGDVSSRTTEGYGGSRRSIGSGSHTDQREWRSGIQYLPGPGAGGRILAVQNLLAGGSTGGLIRMRRLNPYTNGRLVVLGVEGTQLVERSATPKYDGVIEGFDVGRFRGRGPEALLLVETRASYGSFARDRVTLVVFPIE